MLREISDSDKLSNRQQSFLSLALRVATDSENRHRHGAVLVKGGSVLAIAPNILKNNPELFQVCYPVDSMSRKREIREHCSVHAEARVVKMAGDAARGATVYVARVNNFGEALLSKPCEYCHETLVAAGVKTVVYTDYHDNFQSNRAA